MGAGGAGEKGVSAAAAEAVRGGETRAGAPPHRLSQPPRHPRMLTCHHLGHGLVGRPGDGDEDGLRLRLLHAGHAGRGLLGAAALQRGSEAAARGRHGRIAPARGGGVEHHAHGGACRGRAGGRRGEGAGRSGDGERGGGGVRAAVKRRGTPHHGPPLQPAPARSGALSAAQRGLASSARHMRRGRAPGRHAEGAGGRCRAVCVWGGGAAGRRTPRRMRAARPSATRALRRTPTPHSYHHSP